MLLSLVAWRIQEDLMTKQKYAWQRLRFLKIGYLVYEIRSGQHRGKSRQIPYLRLSGDWLQAAGFQVGCKVRVQVVERALLVHVVED